MTRFVFLFLFAVPACDSNDGFTFLNQAYTKKIYIQPFNDIPAAYSSHILSEVKKLYAEVSLLVPLELPKQAWMNPENATVPTPSLPGCGTE